MDPPMVRDVRFKPGGPCSYSWGRRFFGVARRTNIAVAGLLVSDLEEAGFWGYVMDSQRGCAACQDVARGESDDKLRICVWKGSILLF